MSGSTADEPVTGAVSVMVVTTRHDCTPQQFCAMSERSGWDLIPVPSLDVAIESCRARWPTVAVVDTRNVDSIECERAIKWFRAQARIPLVTVTAPEDLDARLLAIRYGSDDHAVAPVDAAELFARVAALVRRATRLHSRIIGDLVVDRQSRRVLRRGKEVTLTPSELSLLDRLLATPGQVVPKEELLHAIGGTARTANAIEVHVSSLRRKLEQAGPPVVHTVHGQGYVIRPVPTFDMAHRAELLEMRERLVRQREEAMARRDRILADMDARVARSQVPRTPD